MEEEGAGAEAGLEANNEDEDDEEEEEEGGESNDGLEAEVDVKVS